MKEKKFYKNRFGISIVQCCASCINSVTKNGETAHICKAGEGLVPSSSWCGQWSMKVAGSKAKPGEINLDNAGMGGGFVKRKSYLNFVLNYPQPEEAIHHVPISQIRSEYEKKFGSIYLNTK